MTTQRREDSDLPEWVFRIYPKNPVMDSGKPLRGYFCGYGGFSFGSGVGATGSFDDVISGGATSADVPINRRWALFTHYR